MTSPYVSCEKKKNKQTNGKKNLEQSVAKTITSVAQKKIFGRRFMLTIYAKKATSPFVRKYSLYGATLTTMISSTRVK